MNPLRKYQVIDILFYISVFFKGLDGVLEIAGGALLCFVHPSRIHSIIKLLTQHELSEDPTDLVANFLRHSTHHLTTSVTLFAAAYLLWHGAVKVGLVVALLLKRRWAYPVAIIAFSIFLIYQFYRYSHTHSMALLVLSFTDVIVIAVTYAEYKRLSATHGFATKPRRMHS